MDFEKRCQWCGKSFIAHKMTTLYCSKSCTGKAYKAKQKKKMKEESEREQLSSSLAPEYADEAKQHMVQQLAPIH